jgi:aminoglycoside phosphotransferase (APT) family kinase protein
LAAELGLRIKQPLPGGIFGATVVEDRDGLEMVLKAEPGESWAPKFARSAALAERLRSRGYPAPLYVSIGVVGDTSWSLQERLPGATPPITTRAHAAQLLDLVQQHAGAADSSERWRDAAMPAMAGWIAGLGSCDSTGTLAKELGRTVRACGDADLREGDVVHGDFSHRNCLASGERITGIIDWEQACVGDWRLDLISLAYWAQLQPTRVDAAAGAMLSEAVRAACPPEVHALFTAYLALRHLDFESRMRPAGTPRLVAAIEARVAQWWRLGARAA